MERPASESDAPTKNAVTDMGSRSSQRMSACGLSAEGPARSDARSSRSGMPEDPVARSSARRRSVVAAMPVVTARRPRWRSR